MAVVDLHSAVEADLGNLAALAELAILVDYREAAGTFAVVVGTGLVVGKVPVAVGIDFAGEDIVPAVGTPKSVVGYIPVDLLADSRLDSC